jgi:hypothetical protein
MPVEVRVVALCDRCHKEGAEEARFVDHVTTTKILLCPECRQLAREFFAPGEVGPGGVVQGIESLKYLTNVHPPAE